MLEDFDSIDTNLYKIANKLSTPAKYLLKDEALRAGYTSINQYIRANMKTKSLIKIYQELVNKYHSNVTELDIIFLYTMEAKKDGATDPVLINHINQFHSSINKTKAVKKEIFEDQDSFRLQEKIFNDRYFELIKKDLKLLNEYKKIQQLLVDIEPIQIKPPEIKTLLLNYIPTRNDGSKITPIDGIDIFISSVLSNDVPFIQYNDSNGKQMQSIYSVNITDSNIYDLIIPKDIKEGDSNCIFLRVYKMAVQESYTEKSYTTIKYDLNTGMITIPADIVDGRENILCSTRVTQALPIIKLGDSFENHISGFFDMEPVEIFIPIIHYMTINDPLFSTFLYIMENLKSCADKDRYNIHYNTLGRSNLVNIVRKKKSTAASVSISFEPNKSDNYTRVKITKAQSMEVLNQFIMVFSRLIKVYKDNKDNLVDLFRKIIIGSCPRVIVNSNPLVKISDAKDVVVEKRVVGKAPNKAQNLKRKFPSVFTTGYASGCQCPFQPIIIKADEVDEWKNNYITDNNGNQIERPVLQFPPPNGGVETKVMFYTVCPYNEFPYINLKKITKSTNKDYPLLPCCTKGNNLTGEKISSFYSNENSAMVIGSKSNYRGSSTKTVDPDREANLNPLIGKLLQSVNKNYDFVRIGCPKTPNSLIHAVLNAVQDNNYTKMGSNFPLKEEYAISVRRHMANGINPLVYKQECYDLTEQQIVNNLNDLEHYLDPAMYYRGLEAIFNVNIYVFNLDKPTKLVDGFNDKESDVYLEVPRSKLLHIRTKINRDRTILIGKHISNDTDHIQCELIISKGIIIEESNSDEEEDQPVIRYGVGPKVIDNVSYAFDNKINNLMYDTLTNSMHYYVFTSRDSKTEARDKPYSNIDWLDIFKDYKIIGQRVDTYGKMRILGIKLPSLEQITIYLPPSQPLDLPHLEEITTIDYNKVVKIFGPANGKTDDGVWYKILDYTYGFFVLSNSVPKNIKAGPSSPINVESTDIRDPITNFRNNKKNANILVQLIEWLWLLDVKDTPDIPNSLIQWWSRYVTRVDKTDNNYDPKRIIRKIDRPTSTREGLLLLGDSWPQFFTARGIKLYDILHDKLYSYFKRRSIEIDGLSTENIKLELTGIYDNDFDFQPKANTIIFNNKKHMNSWVRGMTQQKLNPMGLNPIRNTLSRSITLQLEPYLFRHTSGKVYIIQNVEDGDFKRAINLAINWRLYKINEGYAVTKLDTIKHQVPPYVVYGISNEELMTPIVNNTDPDNPTDYLELLDYDPKYNPQKVHIKGNYCALLPIL